MHPLVCSQLRCGACLTHAAPLNSQTAAMGISAPLKLRRAVPAVTLLGGLSLVLFWAKFFNDQPPVTDDEFTALVMCFAATFFVRPVLAFRPLALRL